VSPAAAVTPEPQPLRPASPAADPLAFVAWLMTPIFQGLFILLATLFAFTGNILVAIMLMTLMIRVLTVRLSAKQIVSQIRMQRLAPEIKALQDEIKRRYRGDRQATMAANQEATAAFYKERGVSPTAGCLPSLLQMGLLFPMYWVISGGLTSYDPRPMLEVFGVNLVPSLQCQNAVGGVLDKAHPCINTIVSGIDWSKPQVLFGVPMPLLGTLGVSALALVAALMQFVQSRMLMPPAIEGDANSSTQRTMMVMFPFFSILYGGILPAGLFIYWIVTSGFSIIQQFLYVGWGNMFPLFGWEPGFARNMKPRFPVTLPEPSAAGGSSSAARGRGVERYTKVAPPPGRPTTHRRTSRRGRRR
jgi:YidC/Oxa1 family membrane protein insertase